MDKFTRSYESRQSRSWGTYMFVSALIILAVLSLRYQGGCSTLAGVGRDLTCIADGVGKEIGRAYSQDTTSAR